MAVREFNGTTDLLACDVGATSGMTFGTAAVIAKFNNTVLKFEAIPGYFHNSGGTFTGLVPLYLLDSGHWGMHSGGADSECAPGGPSTGIWYLAVCRKVTGTATPRFSIYNYNSTTWTHSGGLSTLADTTAAGAGGTIQFSFQAGTSDLFDGRVAARAFWSNSLPWTADASGDTAIEGSGLKTAASSWLSNSPTAFHLFNQASTATPVEDLSTAGTADQTSITGTTVINGDDPPGFDFTLGGAPPAAVQAAQAFPAF